jgi:hypothetical protein
MRNKRQRRLKQQRELLSGCDDCEERQMFSRVFALLCFAGSTVILLLHIEFIEILRAAKNMILTLHDFYFLAEPKEFLEWRTLLE